MYDLTVAGHPSFYTGLQQILVHNCIDSDELSQYNAIEYRRVNITGEEVGPEEDAILAKIDFPSLHLAQGRYERFWMGMDIGLSVHPSEIAVFGEYKKTSRDQDSTLRLLLRVHMMRVKMPHQAEVIRWLVAQYRPTVFAMDSTGMGQPFVQHLQVLYEREALDPALAELRQETERTLNTIKGYNFSAKVPVAVQEAYTDSDGVEHEEELIMRNVQNASTDMLRTLVDTRRLELPWDKDMIGQYQGQTFSNTKSSMDAYGKRSYSLGAYHFLDACRMAAIGYSNYKLEEMLRLRTKAEKPAEIFLSFIE